MNHFTKEKWVLREVSVKGGLPLRRSSGWYCVACLKQIHQRYHPFLLYD